MKLEVVFFCFYIFALSDGLSSVEEAEGYALLYVAEVVGEVRVLVCVGMCEIQEIGCLVI